MNNLEYIGEPVMIKGTDYVIAALSNTQMPYGLKREAYFGDESYDLERSVPLIPLFTRMVESGNDSNVPDFRDLEKSVEEATIKIGSLRSFRGR